MGRICVCRRAMEEILVVRVLIEAVLQKLEGVLVCRRDIEGRIWRGWREVEIKSSALGSGAMALQRERCATRTARFGR